MGRTQKREQGEHVNKCKHVLQYERDCDIDSDSP